MTTSLTDYRNYFLMWLALLLDDGFKAARQIRPESMILVASLAMVCKQKWFSSAQMKF